MPVEQFLSQKEQMRVLASSIILILSLSHGGFSQSKSETVEWINEQGEQTIKQLTGNTSLHWELDEYGSFRITDFNPRNKQLAKRYTYLNLYELKLGEMLIQDSKERGGKILVLSCRKEKGSCIKTRNDFENASLKSIESTTFTLNLLKDFDVESGKRLEEILTKAIKSFQGKTTN